MSARRGETPDGVVVEEWAKRRQEARAVRRHIELLRLRVALKDVADLGRSKDHGHHRALGVRA